MRSDMHDCTSTEVMHAGHMRHSQGQVQAARRHNQLGGTPDDKEQSRGAERQLTTSDLAALAAAQSGSSPNRE